MNFKMILGSATYTLKKYSPEILLGVGVVGVVGSAVLACKATLKVEEVLDEHTKMTCQINEGVMLRESSNVDYSVQDETADRRALMFATTGKFIRLYGPSVTLMTVSVGCILGAHHIVKKRNVALMAAYKLIEEAFGNYRKRVVSEFGEQVDNRFYYGTETVEGSPKIKVVDEDGNERELELARHNLSGFSRLFEADKPDQFGGWLGSTQWSKIHEYNLDFLKAKEDHFNNMLLIKGFVTVNDVYSELGFPSTEAGMICGWRYKSDRGDGYISFKPRTLDGNWAFGQDGCSIILDFNIDGVIFDQQVARKEMK